MKLSGFVKCMDLGHIFQLPGGGNHGLQLLLTDQVRDLTEPFTTSFGLLRKNDNPAVLLRVFRHTGGADKSSTLLYEGKEFLHILLFQRGQIVEEIELFREDLGEGLFPVIND